MPTFKPVISAHQRRADGSYNIKIRITHKRVSRWLPTNLTAYPSDLTRTLNFKNKNLEYKCNDLIREMRATIADLSTLALEDKDVDWLVDYIKQKLKGDTFRLDFFAFADDYLKANKIPATSRTYYSAIHAFQTYLGRNTLDINEITHTMLLNFKEWVDAQPKLTYRYGRNVVEKSERKQKLPGGAQSSRDIMKLAHIYNKAKDRYNDEDAGIFNIPRNPFKNIPLQFPPSRKGQRAFGQETMQLIISATNATPAERVALDTFILSFITMGANLVDLYKATPPQDGVWRYNRSKTKDRRADRAELVVKIPPQAVTFCHRLCGDGEYWLKTLHEHSPKQVNVTSYINKLLKSWAKRNELPPFTFYAARKTWATIARRAGVEKATIDECLCHIGELKMADIYIEKDYDLINKANDVVLSQFLWPTME